MAPCKGYVVGVLLAYAACTISYSMFLKHEPVIELALLALGFLLRAIAGGVASELPISQWFLIVAGFGSLFMAAGKRYSELIHNEANGDYSSASRRSLAGYTPTYLRFVWATSAAVTITGYCLWAFEVSAAPSTLPWALWDWHAFIWSVIKLQFFSPFRPDSMSFVAWLARAHGVRLPALVAFAAAFAAALLGIWRAPRTPAGFAAATGFAFMVFFALSKQAFSNYYFFVITCLCASVAATCHGAKIRAR